MEKNDLKKKLVEKFFRYVAIQSQSQAGATTIPSSQGQMELAKLLQEELEKLELVEIQLTEEGILTAKLPGNFPKDFTGRVAPIGFVAHLDTVDVNLSPLIKPHVVEKYNGQDVLLNAEQDIWMRVAEHQELLQYMGDDIIVSDGTSVLGADNKAAIAGIMVALERFKTDASLYHGDIFIAFLPDEEIGLRGAKAMDLKDFPVEFAYTIDSCELGEVVYETFNAGSVVIHIKGITAHPMSAKGVLVNPTLIANDMINQLDKKDTPEYTEGKEGYFWVTRMVTNPTIATLHISIRDFDKKNYEARKSFMVDLIELISARNPKAQITYEITDVYGNIADSLTEDKKQCIDFIYQAMKNLEIAPKTISMRGGTDGSALSARGIPTPNFFTGAHNFHSNCEFLPISSFEKSCGMVLEIAKLVYAENS
jgi:tripeptide aminopeptidase